MYIPKAIKKIPIVRNLIYGKYLYCKYRKVYKTNTLIGFYIKNIRKIRSIACGSNSALAVEYILNIVDINPIKYDSFYYSIDPFKGIRYNHCVFDNYTINYQQVVCGSLRDLCNELSEKEDHFAVSEINIINGIETYINRIKKYAKDNEIKQCRINAINTLIDTPAQSFYEALQRILFINQIMWQTSHKLNGLGHLDRILIDLYTKDINDSKITKVQAEKYLEDFFKALHEYFWFKSSVLPGDTGQIIILGGMTNKDHYTYNELTSLFIKVAQRL